MTSTLHDMGPSAPAVEALRKTGPLARLGVLKAHWECWAKCSLACSFCYRSVDRPLDPGAALDLLRILRDGGISELVFAGGDPSLRRDLPELIVAAAEMELRTEVQTNAQVRTPAFLAALEATDLVGLSIDGGTPAQHDTFRERVGNFDRVIALAEHLESRRRPFVVRTVVSRANVDAIAGVGALIGQFTCLRRWSLVQFTPIGDGFTHRSRYEISDQEFHDSAWNAATAYTGAADVNVYPNKRKAGIYFIVGPGGDVHGDVDGSALADYPSLGNLLTDGLDAIVDRISFNPTAHASRYQGLLTGTDSP